jgi:hypothetical protein
VPIFLDFLVSIHNLGKLEILFCILKARYLPKIERSTHVSSSKTHNETNFDFKRCYQK